MGRRFIDGLSPEKVQDYAEQFFSRSGTNQRQAPVGIDPFAQQGSWGSQTRCWWWSTLAKWWRWWRYTYKIRAHLVSLDPTLQQCVPVLHRTHQQILRPHLLHPRHPQRGTLTASCEQYADAYPFVLTPPVVLR